MWTAFRTVETSAMRRQAGKPSMSMDAAPANSTRTKTAFRMPGMHVPAHPRTPRCGAAGVVRGDPRSHPAVRRAAALGAARVTLASDGNVGGSCGARAGAAQKRPRGVFAEASAAGLVCCSGQTGVIQDESVRFGLNRGGCPYIMGLWRLVSGKCRLNQSGQDDIMDVRPFGQGPFGIRRFNVQGEGDEHMRTPSRVALIGPSVLLFLGVTPITTAGPVTNPSFENQTHGRMPNGNYTDGHDTWGMPDDWQWRVSGSVNGHGFSATAFPASDGDWFLYLFPSAGTHLVGDFLEFFQSVDLRDVNSLAFDTRLGGGRYSNTYFAIDTQKVWIENEATPLAEDGSLAWMSISIDTSDLSTRLRSVSRSLRPSLTCPTGGLTLTT